MSAAEVDAASGTIDSFWQLPTAESAGAETAEEGPAVPLTSLAVAEAVDLGNAVAPSGGATISFESSPKLKGAWLRLRSRPEGLGI